MIIFEQQFSIKFTQKRNYRNTNFFYISFLNQANWSFISKHSALQPNHLVDIVGYNNNINIFFITQTLHTLDFITLYNINILNRGSNLILIGAGDQTKNSIKRAYPSSSFYERELTEMFPIAVYQMTDSRNLLLEYGSTQKPLTKANTVWGEAELVFCPADDLLARTTPTVFTI
jgi:NADH:ubiquinone oxidoreductase subunit C